MPERQAEGLPDDAVRALLTRWLPDRAPSFARAGSGGSTAVYRVVDGTAGDVFFPRLAEEAGESRAAAGIAGSGLLKRDVVGRLSAVMERWLGLTDEATGQLAPGDLDVPHIFVQGEPLTYSGLIEPGEIRGADRLYDLGHALLQDCQSDRPPIFAALLAGYQGVSRLPAAALAEIRD